MPFFIGVNMPRLYKHHNIGDIVGTRTLIRYLGQSTWEASCNKCGTVRVGNTSKLRRDGCLQCHYNRISITKTYKTHEVTKEKHGVYRVRCFNCTKSVRVNSTLVKNFKCSFCNRHNSRARFVGKVFGDLTILNINIIKTNEAFGTGRVYVDCACHCGNLYTGLLSAIKGGNTRSCGCRAQRLGESNKGYKGFKELSGSHWGSIKAACKRGNRTIPFNLDIKDAYALFIKQKGLCALSGQPIQLIKNKIDPRHNPYIDVASLDRIDSSKGYEIGNIQWVGYRVNVAKWNLTDSDFIKLCESIVKTYKQKEAA